MLVDTHCHLDARTYPEGIDRVLERARAAGVVAAEAVGVSGRGPAEEALALARRRSEVVAVLGIHPHDAADCGDDLDVIEPWLADDGVVAVGETGLDFHYDHSPRAVQIEVFRRTIQLARRVNKPLVVHTRAAPNETLAILEAEGAREVGGVIHCFSEDHAFAVQALDLGFDLGFTGLVTFPKAASVRETAIWAPLDRILLETDSPYLSPVPLRGKRCEPAFLEHTARFLAQARGISLVALAEATTENARRRFGVPLARALGV
jgi:TatD DNase family protein